MIDATLLERPVGDPAFRTLVGLLTPTEREVLRLMASGYTARAIGSLRGCSHRTVETHRDRVLEKLEASNSCQAVVVAVKAGLL